MLVAHRRHPLGAAGLMQASFYFGYMLMVCYGECLQRPSPEEPALCMHHGADLAARAAGTAAPNSVPAPPSPPPAAGFFLMLGSVGFRASLAFVRHIYKVRRGRRLDALSMAPLCGAPMPAPVLPVKS